MTRSTEEWIGKTDDTAAPPRVRARTFERFGGLCHKCWRKITAGEPWTLEHLIALENGGRNAESNLTLTCSFCTPIKNAEDAAIKKHGTQVRYRHMGIKTTKRPIQSAGFGKPEAQQRATKPVNKWRGWEQ